MAETHVRGKALTLRATVKGQNYDLNLGQLTGRDHQLLQECLNGKPWSLNRVGEGDEMAARAIILIAVRRRQPKVTWDDILDLPSLEVDLDIADDDEEGSETADPFAPSPPKASAAKKPSRKSSDEDSSTTATSGDQS